jgi:hypothetical protein
MNSHIFVSPGHAYWHCFYFDQRDVDENEPHWQHFPHIHFVNYLWPNLTAQGVWDTIRSEKPELKSALHIRWSHPKKPEYVPRELDDGDCA